MEDVLEIGQKVRLLEDEPYNSEIVIPALTEGVIEQIAMRPGPIYLVKFNSFDSDYLYAIRTETVEHIT